MPVLEVEHLSKRFGAFTALNDVSLTVRRGEILGLVGPDGSGKTTALQIIMGILRASKGSVKLFGENAWKNAVPLHRRVAYVPGDVRLWGNLTGGETIDLIASMGGGIDEKRRKDLLRRFDLPPGRKCRAYSRGERQKAAIIAALASNVELYILDEPASGLDPVSEKIFEECVLELKGNGHSFILATQSPSEAEALCDGAVVLRKGHIADSGSIAELRSRARTRVLVQTRAPLPPAEALPGVYAAQAFASCDELQVETCRLGELMEVLCRLGIVKLECQPPAFGELRRAVHKAKKPVTA
jgi:ABC-2 type transport system ATP-binding protein